MPKLQQQIEKSIVLTENEIRLIKQSDGNWKGYLLRGKERLEVREIDPQTCLVRLLTHP
jgi:hypothetical protein